MPTRDRRRRNIFWIDDRIIDEFAPAMRAHPCGTAALAVYVVLARRADRDGASWPRLKHIAADSGTSARTVQRAIRLLEVLRLIEVTLCYEEDTHRQTSNLYTLLTPPDPLPKVSPDPETWPLPTRRSQLVPARNRADSLRATMPTLDTLAELENTSKESPWAGDGKTATPQDDQADEQLSPKPVFVIEEIGLSNRQVWAATLAALARQGDLTQSDVDSWLRPAALIGRDGNTLIIGAPNAVSRDQIWTRFLPAVRAAISATIGAEVQVEVVVGNRVIG